MRHLGFSSQRRAFFHESHSARGKPTKLKEGQMTLINGFTRFRGEIMNKLDARMLRSLTKRLRQQIRSKQDDKADQTFREMMAFASRYPQLRQPILDLLTEEINKLISSEATQKASV
jgi:hypothetical protein